MAQDVIIPAKRTPSPGAPTGSDDPRAPGGADGDGEVPGDLAALRAATLAWRNGTLAKSAARMPARKPRFATWSDVEVARRPARPADVPVDYAKDLGFPGEYPFTRGVQPTMYREPPLDDAACSPASAPRSRRTRASTTCSSRGRRGSRPPSISRRSWATTRDSPRSLGEVGMCGVAVDTLRDMEVLFDGIPLDKVTTSMTINGPAIVLLAFYIALADQRGIAADEDRRHRPERLPEGVHRPARLARPAAAGDAHRDRHDRVLREGGAALEHGLDQRLPHPRGGEHGGAGAGVHAGRRHRLRRELPRSAASTSTTSRRASRSSSTCTTTSSRRSPSSAPRAGSGRGS